ncbi:MAG: DUF3883 domain-containing protein, partial [Anaerolineaceae bacterium]|nr:DUF3883 domain-containing protein [Anaerolineaceae bacterium]
ETERILETLVETKETKFRLPWAFEESDVRLELGIQPVDRDHLNYYEHQIEKSIESAALFLKQIKVLELKRNGHLVRRIETLREEDRLLLSDGEGDIIWKVYEGRFDDVAEVMRRKYGGIIEQKRTSVVKIAIPDTPEINGLLYAFLPSEDSTELPFHINADFYPTPDRKRIIFDEGYKKEWNEAAIQCAAETLAAHCEDILGIYSNQGFWEFVDRVEKASERRRLTSRVSLFWEKLHPEIEQRKSVLTSLDTVVLPSEAIFLDVDELVNAEAIFTDLEINCVHPDLRSKLNVLRKTGVKNLITPYISEAFLAKGWTQRTEIHTFPESLQTQEGWVLLWDALNKLLDRAAHYNRLPIQNDLKTIPIAFGSDGAVWPPNQLFQADTKTISFFSKISSVTWYDEKYEPGKLPSQLVPHFSVQDGLDLLEETQGDLQALYEQERFSPLEMLEWLEEHRNQLFDSHRQAIKELSVWPTGEKQLKPLEDLFLAGDFEDPLQLAQLVNLEALGGRRDFLQEYLKVPKLDFHTYVSDWVPDVIRNHDLGAAEKHELIKILAEHRSNLVGDDDLREMLSTLPIIWCEEEEFYPASEVWFNTQEVHDVLGSEIKVAKLPFEKQETIRELYEWLGVLSEPRPKDIVKRIKEVVQEPPTDRSRQLIGRLIGFIASKWAFWEEQEREKFSSLRNFEWLPSSKNQSKWFDPENIYSIYSRDLFDSVGNFLLVDYLIQRNSSDFFQLLGIESEPKPGQVVQHLLWSSKNDQPITNRIYDFLNRKNNVDSPAIYQLVGEKCLYLKDSDGNSSYYSPDQVFWEQHSFGEYRFRLPPEFGQFTTLLDKLSVRFSPDAHDAIKVLLEISKKFGSSNIPLPEDTNDEAILIFCWKMINEALDNEQVSASEVMVNLGGEKTIPDSRNILVKPELMFFEDRPGWGNKFLIVKNNLTPRIEGAWQAMESAGVRPLSSVITTEMVELGNPIEDSIIVDLLRNRINLIRRVIESHRNQGNKGLRLKGLENLTFYKAEQIDIVRVFNGFGKQEPSDLESVDAILADDAFYYAAQNGSLPWRGIARELSYVINPTGEICSLGMELNVILSQTIEEAVASLDDWGYPRIEVQETDIPEGVTLGAADEVDLPESIRVGIPHPDGVQGETPTTTVSPHEEGQDSAGVPTGSRTSLPPTTDRPKTKKRKTSRLVSYVYPEDAFSTRQEDTSFAKKRTKLGKTGVRKVMEFEIQEGRTPRDMEEVQVNHPGYDIESTSEDGSIRYIEVKSFSGIWDSQNPAQMTKNEFMTAKRKGEDFWLYVVEQAESEDSKIHQIHDPANRADYFLFDHGWMIKTEE